METRKIRATPTLSELIDISILGLWRSVLFFDALVHEFLILVAPIGNVIIDTIHENIMLVYRHL